MNRPSASSVRKRPSNYVVAAAIGLVASVTWLTAGSGGRACLGGRCLIPPTLLSMLAAAPEEHPPAHDAAITAAVDGFHDALAHGDAAAAMKFLAPDATILEKGASQTRDEYAREHLAEDIAFAHATTTTRTALTVKQQGDVAWTSTTSRTTGIFNGRKIDSDGVELMVLTKSESGWRIRVIHWSSHKR